MNFIKKLLDSEYKDIIIKPKSLTKSIDKGKYQIPTEIKFNDTVLDNTVINISNYQISEMFKEKYDYCLDATCYKNTYVVKPMSYGNNTILRIESNLNMDKNIFMNKYIKNASDFYKYYSLNLFLIIHLIPLDYMFLLIIRQYKQHYHIVLYKQNLLFLILTFYFPFYFI